MLTGLQKFAEDKCLIPGGTTLQETGSFEKWMRNTEGRKTEVQWSICPFLSTK